MPIVRVLLQQQQFVCHWCEISLKSSYGEQFTPQKQADAAGEFYYATIDHVLAISRGGTNDLNNLVAACSSCNNGRNDGFRNHKKKQKPVQRPQYTSLAQIVQRILKNTVDVPDYEERRRLVREALGIGI